MSIPLLPPSEPLTLPRSDHHAEGFRGLGDPEHRCVVRHSRTFWPDELEAPQQCHQHQEELHPSQPLPQTHAGAWRETLLSLTYQEQYRPSGHISLHHESRIQL